MARDESKFDQDWLSIIAGNTVIKMDNKLRLKARLVRAALVNRKLRIESQTPSNAADINERLRLRLEEEGLLAPQSKYTKKFLDHKIKALVFLLISGTVVWATKIEPHFTKPMVAGNFFNEETKEETVQQSFRKNFFDHSGAFTGFWSRLNNYVALVPDPKDSLDNQCNPKLLTIEGCLSLALKFDSAAQFNLGLMYEQGINVAQDYNRALDWYKKSAALGNTQAKFNMNYIVVKKLVE